MREATAIAASSSRVPVPPRLDGLTERFDRSWQLLVKKEGRRLHHRV